MAHVQKRDGRWQARYRGPDGREHTKRFDRKVDAERWLTAEQGKLLRGDWVDPVAGKVALNEYAARWMARMAPTWRASTSAAVRNNIEHHVLPILGRRPMVSLRKCDVEALYTSLALAPSSVGTLHQHLSQMLSSAVEDGLIPRNPASKARRPKQEPSKAQPLPLDVVEAIQAGLPEWMAVAIPLGIGAGLRQGEASGLTVDRVDFLRRTLRVDRQLVCRRVPEPVLVIRR